MTLPIAKRLHREWLPPEAEEWLRSGKRSWWYYLELGGDEERAREFWAVHRDAVVRNHVEREPGSRPLVWWLYTAPKPRKRLGGTGTPMHECSNTAPSFCYGVPEFWRRPEDASYLSSGVPISAEDPPIFESEASYLKRLKLLLTGEARRLRRRDFWPEVVRVSDGYVRLCRVNPT